MSTEEPSSQSRKQGFFDRITSHFRDEPDDEGTAKNDLAEALSEARASGVIAADAFSMIEGALKVSDLRASDLMIPRAQVDAVDLTDNQNDWIRKVIESGHSRFPAVEGDLDEVAGILHAKDLLKLLIDPKIDPRTMLRPARFIPESQPINVLLKDFKATRSHLALVIDEFGSISGLITIEDVLEQIVGDISDEFDRDDSKANIVPEGDGTWRVRAYTPIEQFNDYFGARLQDDYCETIGGLVTDRFEHVPKVGETIEENGFLFRIIRGDDRQVELLSVERH
ncbi:HlyC/CorC family transporter [Sutterella sp.]|uniref:HlyC/CorC family transporter n=1 Tax=Sutterella sp. TaxID=1981025 RepID=UPI0026DFC7B8|nr:transporter associated domain-containing protein [Sutterella sp.]MDO5531031.1 transporter associated domain-containing protein [Sutterella sp.]